MESTRASWTPRRSYTLHIEGASGKQTTYREFRTRVLLLDSPLNKNGEMIAIISYSSSVRVRERFLSAGVSFTVTFRTVLHLSIPCFFLRPHSFCLTHAGHPSSLRIECFEAIQTDPTVRAGSTSSNVRPNSGRVHSCGKYAQKIEGYRTFEKMVEDARSQAMAPLSLRPASRDTLAYLMFSSGTTGPPKGR